MKPSPGWITAAVKETVNEGEHLEIPITHKIHLKDTPERFIVNLPGLKKCCIPNHILSWCGTLKAYMRYISSTFPPLCSSYGLRAAAVAHPPPSCLIHSYFSDKSFGYAQVLTPPAIPSCLLPYPSATFPYQMTNRKPIEYQVQKYPSNVVIIVFHSSNSAVNMVNVQCDVP